MRFFGLFFFVLIALNAVKAQVSYSPQYPTLSDSVEIIFDATQGNAALSGVNTVYMHTGVISEHSLSNADWKHRINPWPTGDPDLVINDTIVMMQNIGNNQHRIKFKPSTFYGTNQLTDYNALAFVFRNQDGSLAGKTVDDQDIFIPIFKTSNLDAMFRQPLTNAYRVTALNDPVDVEVLSNQNASISLYLDGAPIAQASGTDNLNHTFSASTPGKHWLRFEVNASGNIISDSIYYLVDEPTVVQDPPFASLNGINYVDDSTVLLQLYAPNKSFAYVIGDFNNWQIDPAYRMNRTVDGTAYWVEISGLTPQQEYRFQYMVDQQVVIADPWADKYLDEFNDIDILFFTYPNLIDYPTGYTNGMVSVLQTAQTPFNWQNTTFNRPLNQDLVIYELLIRDFVLRHDYTTLIDTLDYLENLGINAIELMPINEFDDNKSWGYSPAFYFAPDKYYGPKSDLKRFIDECHSRGIAIILDVVFNHAFSQNTMSRLYLDNNSGKPTNDNPWFNSYIPHPFGFNSDFDHSSFETQYFVDRCLEYWLTEYKVDGFRFDLSKGFTNVYSYPSDLGLWGTFDNDRVYWLKRIFDEVRSYDNDCYMILEHFANNDEETDLANHGFMLWGNAHSQYKQAALGYQNDSDFKWFVSSNHRGWTYQHLVGFMESHDEERIMYDCKEYGNMFIDGNNDTLYNIRALETALKRVEMCGAFFYTVPGPKMLWQFGELGYDFSINFNGRTKEKPLRWNYLQDPNRLRLYKAFSAFIDLKTQNTAFRTSNYDLDVWGNGKRMWVTDPSMNVTIIGNFGVTDLNTMMPGFQHTGEWYDYMTGDTIQVNDVNAPIPLAPGEYHIFTDQRLTTPDLSVNVTEIQDQQAADLIVSVSPNPFKDQANISFFMDREHDVKLSIRSITGQVLHQVNMGRLAAGLHDYTVRKDMLQANGIYIYTIEADELKKSGQILKLD